MFGDSDFIGAASDHLDRQMPLTSRYACVPYPVELAVEELRQGLRSAQIRILMLRRFAHPVTGEWETTTEEIAQITRLSRSAVQKGLRALERAKWLYVQHLRTRTFRLIVSFGGFPDPRYLREGRPPLVWDGGFPGWEGRAELTSLSPIRHALHTKLVLKLTHSHVLTALNKGVLHLRVNIILPVGSNRLKVAHSYNMDRDADRDLELGGSAGAAGRCWHTRSPVVCDLEDARETFATKWRMSEDQQTHVRPSLRSLLSVPIFGPTADRDTPDKSTTPLGILSFDSDDDLRRDFRGSLIQEAATECAAVVATWLSGRTADSQ